MDSGTVLGLTGLNIMYSAEQQQVMAVSDISLSVDRGKTLGIVGESGSGKTTLALSLMRLLPGTSCAVSGKATFYRPGGDPVSLFVLPEKVMQTIRGREISMVFQDPMSTLNPVITCGSQIDEVLIRHEGLDRYAARHRSLALLEKTALHDPLGVYDEYPHRLSGGEQQRVMIAMAVACRPALLIADEAATALDATTQAGILNLFGKLRDEFRMAMIFISHDIDVIAEIADNVLVMRHGLVVEAGTAREVLGNPKHAYTRSLCAASSSAARSHARTPPPAQPPGSEKGPLLQGIGLTKHFMSGSPMSRLTKRQVVAVDDVSLEVYRGETLGLVGESGCGKTTLCRMLLGLVKPDAGKILFQGTDLARCNAMTLRKLRKDLQVVFQDPLASLNPRMRVADSILEPMLVHRICHRADGLNKVNELLETIGLDASFGTRYPHQLSAGQRQRVCMARALSLSPSIVICDEPVSSLDATIRMQVLSLMNDLKQRFNLSYIFVSHDMAVVRFMCDRLVVMHRGRLVESGAVDDLFDDPKSGHTKRLIEAIPSGLAGAF